MTNISNDQGTNQGTSTVPAGAEVPPRLRYRAAFQQILPELQAVDGKDLLIINIDVTTAVTTARGALPEIVALRERVAKLPEFNVKQFDTLELYALALMHAQGEYVAASTPPEELQALNEQGLALRDVLHSDASALAKRGLMNGDPLSSFKTGSGYKILAEDLVGLSSLLRNSWVSISGKTAITQAELDTAEDLSDKLQAAVGVREQAPAVLAEVALQRQRVFTLFVEAYDVARRAISFLRWDEGDLETIAPSLYAGRGNVRKKAEQQPVTPPLAATPVVPVTGVPLPTPVTPASANGAHVGLPGSTPFAAS